ncbi:hypothetical protein BD847_3862 [Flavobacterium cutihirudinis]|uniref:Glycosyl transferase family 2 n=1 Tax=Flavobacterium cutihirudinis TaxID=1265740 RepID=A0A3D9FK61_9FLAO|nr:glycosyltransferase family 2 protein [Flavobacterium cutihirudinis]RED19575.1 hypothetical protein BD847_3862 [Flavobacterium cutihirudinis]
MRIGFNPVKEDKEIVVENYHRIIIPVYIPHFEGYFEQTFEIFKLCIDSLLLTIHDKTRITIYNNACHPDVADYIDLKYKESNFIDQVFHSKQNLGKINAILASTKGNLEPLITITDADVFFKENWQDAVEKMMIDFPAAGMICPVPNSKAVSNYVKNNWYYGLFNGKLKFEKVSDPGAMIKFDESLGNKKSLLKQIHLEKYLVLYNKKRNARAVMGAGHFVATLRREVFDKGSNEPAFIKIVGGVENKFIDIPNEQLGYLRISTPENYAYHLGNSIEDWMFEEFSNLKKENKKTSHNSLDFKGVPISRTGRILGYCIQKIISKNFKIKLKVLNLLGLESDDF